MSPRSQEAEAIVLDCRDHGESDLIVTFFCQDIGRVSGIAKGAKKSQKRFVNKLELFSFLHIVYTDPAYSSLLFIQEAELHASFLNLRRDIALYATASVIRECILMATRDGERDENLFRLTVWALHNLDRKRPHLGVLALFLLKFYACIGYKPQLHACLNCGSPVSSSQNYRFNYLGGGIVCPTCVTTSHQTAVPLSRGTVKILQTAQDLPLDRLHRLQFSGPGLDECLNVLHLYGRCLFQRDISSWAMLEDCRRQERRAARPAQM